MNPSLELLLRTLNLNTRLFLNALEGVDDEIATARPNDNTNHMAFIACHLIDARSYLAKLAGRETTYPFKELLEKAKGIDDIEEFPTVEELCSAWKQVSQSLSDQLATLSDDALKKKVEQPFPIEDGGTLLGGINFLLEHDAFHIGQLGFLRRYFGLEAMKYS